LGSFTLDGDFRLPNVCSQEQKMGFLLNVSFKAVSYKRKQINTKSDINAH